MLTSSVAPRQVLELLVIQPTPFCNIDCSYCYLPERSSKRLMRQDTIEKLFSDVFASSFHSEQLTIVWHAGEPLVVGIPFYERALATVARLNQCGVRIVHNIQTNGLLINQ